MTLMMTSAQVVETSVNVTNNSPSGTTLTRTIKPHKRLRLLSSNHLPHLPYILLDVLLCRIAEYFYELCHTRHKQRVKILSDTTRSRPRHMKK